MLGSTLVMLLGLLGGALAIVLLFVLHRTLRPRGTPKIRDRFGRIVPGSVAELLAVDINGARQWLLIRGRDASRPVLLFLHGGPGAAHIGVFRRYQGELERHFVVVQWDQRGAGLSGEGPLDDATLTKEQFVRDGLAVTDYLRVRFKAERIHLVGHSWGTGLGYILAKRHPERYAAYAGIACMSGRQGTLATYRLVMDKARELGDKEAIAALERLGPPPYTKDIHSGRLLHEVEEGQEGLGSFLELFTWVQHFKGDAVRLDMTKVFVRDLLLSREYTLSDALAWMRRKSHLINLTWRECNEDLDLEAEGLDFSIPVFFLLGKSDLQTSWRDAVILYDKIKAPKKDLYWFDCAHHVMWEKTDEYQAALVTAFTGT